jgi:hypothetical protein
MVILQLDMVRHCPTKLPQKSINEKSAPSVVQIKATTSYVRLLGGLIGGREGVLRGNFLLLFICNFLCVFGAGTRPGGCRSYC